MNIIVIGNGFDLAHELPTSYKDFLEWVVGEYNIYYRMRNVSSMKNIKVKLDISENIRRNGKDSKEIAHQTELWECMNDNIWLEYFLHSKHKKNGTWIDFECEISKVIQSLDDDRSTFDFEYYTQLISNMFLNKKYYEADPPITYKQLRDKLLIDLNRLIRAFEIYLAEYVEKIECNLVSPDIQRILPKEIAKINGMPVYDTYILSFNYTNTFQRLYIDKEHNKYFEKYVDYIHGKADINNTVETNNMVLGIDEYLGKKKRNKQVEFIAFKKFYQRIHKGTGCKYKEWTDTIKGEYEYYQTELEKCKTEKNIMNLKAMANKSKKQYLNRHHVYIFGHSLDVTDKDILRDLILNDNVYTTIFYHNKDVMGQQIANLVKVIGQDELIRRTGGSTKTIEFKQQQDMILIKS